MRPDGTSPPLVRTTSIDEQDNRQPAATRPTKRVRPLAAEPLAQQPNDCLQAPLETTGGPRASSETPSAVAEAAAAALELTGRLVPFDLASRSAVRLACRELRQFASYFTDPVLRQFETALGKKTADQTLAHLPPAHALRQALLRHYQQAAALQCLRAAQRLSEKMQGQKAECMWYLIHLTGPDALALLHPDLLQEIQQHLEESITPSPSASNLPNPAFELEAIQTALHKHEMLTRLQHLEQSYTPSLEEWADEDFTRLFIAKGPLHAMSICPESIKADHVRYAELMQLALFVNPNSIQHMAGAKLAQHPELIDFAIAQGVDVITLRPTGVSLSRQQILNALPACETLNLFEDFVPLALLNDIRFITEAVTSCPELFTFLPEQYLNDEHLLRLVLPKEHMAITEAGPALQGRADLWREAIRLQPDLIFQVPRNLMNHELVLLAIEHGLPAIPGIGELIEINEEFLRHATCQNWEAISLAPRNLLTDAALTNHAFSEGAKKGCPLAKRLHSLRNTTEKKQLFRAYLNCIQGHTRSILGELPYAMAKQRSIAKAILEYNGLELRDAPLWQRQDRHLVLAAVRADAEALRYAGEALKNDRDIVLSAVQQDPFSAKWMGEDLRSDPDFLLQLMQDHALEDAAILAPDELFSSRSFCLRLLQYSCHYRSKAMMRIPQRFLADPEFMLQAIEKDALTFKYADERLQIDREFISEALRTHAFCYNQLDDSLRDDAELLAIAMRGDPDAYLDSSWRLRKALGYKVA